ncbi:MAG: AMP-binding protein [Bacteroidaceae bacterium]|nr:AMP-binding protein [Bacteroidaceae bacterium]
MLLNDFLTEWNDPRDTVEVQTSGSTGQPQRMQVRKSRMRASARMTCDFLGLRPGDTALLCMNLRYIGAKMMVVRSLERGLRLISVPPTSHPLATTDEQIDLAAMVPLQVYAALQVPREAERLRRVRHLLIGGGAIDARLEEQLRVFPHAVWSTYGMTETLSHIALRRVNGPASTDFYTPLPGVRVGLSESGCLAIEAPALCDAKLLTNDLAKLLPDGRFRIIGRADNTLVSGGVKVQAEELERLLRPCLPKPFLVTWISDERLGQAVVVLAEDEQAELLCRRASLPDYWWPRHWLHVDRIPLTETGKPARAEAHERAKRMLS